MRQPLTAFVLATGALVTGALAQAASQKPAPATGPDARAFVPEGYRSEIFFDMKALREQDVVEAVTRSLLGARFQEMEHELGFRLQELDSVRVFPPRPRADRGPVVATDGDQAATVRLDPPLSVLQGSARVRLPPREPDEATERTKVAGFDALVVGAKWFGEDADVYVSPRPGLLVVGPRRDLQPVLEGKGRPGVPPGELLSLTAGKGVLAYVAMEITPARLDEFRKALSEGAIDGAEPPRWLAVRLRSEAPANADDDVNLVLEATVRCDQAGKGPAALLAAAKAAIEAGKRHPQLGSSKVWSNLEIAVDGCDLVARLPLGRPREAVNSITQLAAPLMVMQQGERLRAESAPAVKETPPPAPQQGGGRKGG